jgi:hypothetical protein
MLIWTKFTAHILTCCCDITIVYCEQERYTPKVLWSCYNAVINKFSTAVLNCNDSICKVILDLLLLHTSQQMYLIRGNPLLHSLEHPTIISLHALVFEQLRHLVGILQGAVTGEVCCYTLKHKLYSDPKSTKLWDIQQKYIADVLQMTYFLNANSTQLLVKIIKFISPQKI